MISSLLKPTIVVNNKKYKVMKQIGEGGFAFVYNVMSSKDSERFALKKMICQTDEQLDEAKKEIDTMMKVKHPNILTLLDFAYVLNKKGQKEVLLVLPLYNTSVQAIIDQGPGYPHCAFVDGLDVLKILRQIVEGLGAIHACGLRHADLKPANILLSESYQAVITDFGSVAPVPVVVHNRAEALEIQERAASFTTASYRAPELFNTPSEITIGVESDIWSLGCLMYCMYYSRSPFESATEGLSTLSVMSAHYQIPESNLWPVEYQTVIAGCLTAEPAKRATLATVQSSLHCIPCPPLNLRAPTPPPVVTTSPPAQAAGAGQAGGAAQRPLHLALAAQGGLGSSTSTTSSAVSTSQIAFSASTTPFSEHGGAVSQPHTPNSATESTAFPPEAVNFAQFPPPPSTTANTESGGESGAIVGTGDSDGHIVTLSNGAGSFDEFASCGSALSGLVFDDHCIEGSVHHSSVADSGSYVIAEHYETLSNLSTGNNSPHANKSHFGSSAPGTLAAHTPRSHASFEGFELTETQLRQAQHYNESATVPGGDPFSNASALDSVVSTGSNGVAGIAASGSMAGTSCSGDSESSDIVVVHTDTTAPGGAGAGAGAGGAGVGSSVGFESDEEEFGEFTGTSEAAAHTEVKHHPTTASHGSGTTATEAVPPAGKKAGNTEAEVVTALEMLDLWKVIEDEAAQPGSVVKQGPVYMMRQSGFPKRWAKKQVYLALTPHGLILRKDATPQSRIHALLSLHRPTHLTPTDTLSIGLNGLLVQGSSPVPQSAHAAAHSPTPAGGSGGGAEWVKVLFTPTTANHGTRPEAKTAASHTSETGTAAHANAPVAYRVQYEGVRFEISFDSKDVMNEWIDAIMECRESLLP